MLLLYNVGLKSNKNIDNYIFYLILEYKHLNTVKIFESIITHDKSNKITIIIT